MKTSPKTLMKRSTRLYVEDVETVKAAFPDFHFDQVLRHILSKVADQLRAGAKPKNIDIGDIE